MAIPVRLRFLGSVATNVSTATFGVVNPPTSVTLGVSIIVTLTANTNSAASVVSITDDKGNTYSQDKAVGTGAITSPLTAIWSAHSAKALNAGDRIYITLTGFPGSVIAEASEYTGLKFTGARDQTNSAGPTTSANPSAGNVTTTVANEVLIAAAGNYQQPAGDAPNTPGAGWTFSYQSTNTDGLTTQMGFLSEYQIVSATGTYTGNATWQGSSTWTAAMATYAADSPKASLIGVASIISIVRAKANLVAVARFLRAGKTMVACANLTANSHVTVRGQAKLIAVANLRMRLIYGIFVRLGHILGLINAINTHRGTDTPNRVVRIEEDFRLPPPYRNLVDGIYKSLLNYQTGSASTFIKQLDGLADAIVITQMNDNDGLPDLKLITAVSDLIADMRADSQTVQACTVSCTTVASNQNIGNAVVLTSTKDNLGLTLENILPERILLACTADAQASGKPGHETLTASGQIAQTDELAWNWPQGSGTSISLTAVDEASTSSLITDGSFETWSTTTPLTLTNWKAGVGVFGTNILRESVNPYKATYAVRFAGDGSTLLSIYQKLTATSLAEETTYGVNGFVRVDGIPAAGRLEFALTNGTAPASWLDSTDDQGTANKFSIDLSTLTVPNVYVPFSGVFRTAIKLPSSPNFTIRLTTALSNGKNLTFDAVSFVPMKQIYPGGPYLSVHAGNKPLIKNDLYTLTCTNDFGGATAATNFQNCFERLFGMRNAGLVLPSSATPTISNALIV